MATNKPVHIFLWGVPRSVSTAFTRCMENIPNIQIFYEPYCTAVHYGPESRIRPEKESHTEKEYTYDMVQVMLEDKILNEKTVFVKDMAYAIDGKYDKIPRGFKHTFIIRHPAKSFLSYFKATSNAGVEDIDKYFKSWLPEGLCYQELYDLVDFVEKSEGSTPVILDADDLVEHPQIMLAKYCTAVGLPYSDTLLKWASTPKSWKVAQTVLDIQVMYGFQSKAFTSCGFQKTSNKLIPSISELPTCVADCVKSSLPFYEKLKARSICP